MPRETIDHERLEIRLLISEDIVLAHEFSCGDEDLDDFLRSDALRLQDQNVARTFVAWYDGELVGYVSLLTDAIQLKTGERKKLQLTHRDHPVVPALKVGRVGVSVRSREHLRGVGTALIRFAYYQATTLAECAGCRLLTLDAYPQSVGFYEKLGFVRNKSEEQPSTTPQNISMRLDVFAKEPPSWTNVGPSEAGEPEVP